MTGTDEARRKHGAWTDEAVGIMLPGQMKPVGIM